MTYFDEYRVSSPYGYRTLGGVREFHTGIDLVKQHQAPIYAFTGGTVTFAGMGQSGTGLGGYGNVVAIRDKYGALHVYAHLDSVIVRVGDEIDRGKMIGRQGNTGKVSPKPTPANPYNGSHLHYEIRKTSSPRYGWIEDRPNNCYEPTEYLQQYYYKEQQERVAKTGPVRELPNVQRLATVRIGDIEEEGYLINDTTYVPIRFVTEHLGGRIKEWDNKNKIATIERGN